MKRAVFLVIAIVLLAPYALGAEIPSRLKIRKLLQNENGATVTKFHDDRKWMVPITDEPHEGPADWSGYLSGDTSGTDKHFVANNNDMKLNAKATLSPTETLPDDANHYTYTGTDWVYASTDRTQMYQGDAVEKVNKNGNINIHYSNLQPVGVNATAALAP